MKIKYFSPRWDPGLRCLRPPLRSPGTRGETFSGFDKNNFHARGNTCLSERTDCPCHSRWGWLSSSPSPPRAPPPRPRCPRSPWSGHPRPCPGSRGSWRASLAPRAGPRPRLRLAESKASRRVEQSADWPSPATERHEQGYLYRMIIARPIPGVMCIWWLNAKPTWDFSASISYQRIKTSMC